MKKILLTFALLGSFLVCITLQAADCTLEQAVEAANKELGGPYYIAFAEIEINGVKKTMQLNGEVWERHKMLVYGGPDEVPRGVQDFRQGHYRYLGYTAEGDLMPDPDFPPDHNATTVINNYDWYNEPWTYSNPYLCKNKKPEWEGQEKNLPYIRQALREKFNLDEAGNPLNKPLFDEGLKPKNAGGEGQDWHTVVKILQPRTGVTPGLGRLWHNWNGNVWYITIVIPAVLKDITDIEAVSLSAPGSAAVGTKQAASAVFKNNGTKEETFQINLCLDDAVIANSTMTLRPGESRDAAFNWTAPGSPGSITLKAQAVPLPAENRTDNNSKTAAVQIIKITEPVCLPCRETPVISNAWDEVYSIITGYGTKTVCSTDCSTITDEEGNESESCTTDCWEETDYSQKIWEDLTVTYNERLEATLSINTKQGVKTNPQNPQPADHESRGSWEIIPWAKKNGLDPNEVTRSGYGFEVKVETSYTTDWETKIPQGLEGTARPKGGTLQGPDKVTAEFYDTKNRFVRQIEMVPTKGKAGDPVVTWELPPEKTTLPNGGVIYERKHYTQVEVPDGKYRVRVTVSGAGKTGLCIIRTKYVTIYKDMWEDIYTRVSTAGE